jgi:uncharacterized protein (TIGR02099 family)
MLTVARYLHGKFWLFMAWLIIVLAILLTAARQLLPLIDLADYKEEIERIIEAEAGKPLTIGLMQMELHGFRLALKFTDVVLYDKEGQPPLLQAREVRVDIHLLNSLLNGELMLEGGLVVGTQLLIERHADGTVSLQGMTAEVGGGSDSLTELLLGRSHLRLYDSDILLKGPDPTTPPLQLSGVAVDLFNNDDYHSLSVKARVGDQGQETLRIIAELEEGGDDPLAVDGRFYLKGDNLRLGGRLAEWLPEGYSVDRGTLEAEVWGELKNGVLRRLHGTTNLTDFQVAGPATETPFQLDRLASELDWWKQREGWRLDLDHLVLVRAGKLWPPGRLSLGWQAHEKRGRLLRFGADYLSLKELNDLLAIIKLPNEALGDALRGLSANGHLTKFGFALQQPPEGEVSWRVGGVVERFSSNSWQSVPGLSGLHLSFDGNQSGGWLHIESSNFSGEFPRLFRQPISAKRVAGDFTWRFNTQTGLHLNTNHLEMHNEDVETLTRISLDIPLSGTDLFVDMQSDFWNGDGSRKSDYLPVGIMPDALVNWLDRSVVSGRVNSGSFLLYGPLNEFPFHRQQGRFEVWFGVEDLVLDYMPGWPRIEQGVAEAFFVNNSLRVSLQDGMLLGNRLKRVQARIRQLKGATPVEIDGEIRGPFKDMIGLLSDTPLRSRFGPFIDAVEVDGKATAQLSLAIPLKKRDQLEIDGQVTLRRAGIFVKPADLQINDINGMLKFDEKQLSANGLKAKLLGHPLSVNVMPKLTREGRWTDITAEIDVTAQEIRQQFPNMWLPPIQGQAKGKVTLEIAHHPSRVPVSLRVVSNLRELAVKMPAPMNKRAGSGKRMDLSVAFRSDNKTDLRLLYGDEVRAQVEIPAASKAPLMVGIGFSQEPKLPKSGKGYCFVGALNKLNVDQWMEWLGGNEGGEGSVGAKPIEIDMRVESLMLAGIEVIKTHFTARNYADGYRVKMEAENAQGMIQVPGDLKRLPLLGRFDFIKLDLEELFGTISGREESAKAIVEFDPRELPALDMWVDELYVNNQNLGEYHLSWEKEKDGITISQLSLVGEELNLAGQGYWRQTRRGHLTSLNLKARITSLGELQKQLGMPSGIKEASTDIKAELYWPTSPLEMGADKLFGSIWLKVGKGKVTDVDPGVGRLIGLFSLNALGKRLALDFRDFFLKGLYFDTIEGNFTIQDGVASTQDLTMQSSSAKIEFSGETGLVSRTYNQRVVVTPNLSSTLPVVGAIAVNPTVGVALAVTQKFLGKKFDKIVQRTYQVSGSWDEPKFKLISKKPLTDQAPENDMGIDLPGR